MLPPKLLVLKLMLESFGVDVDISTVEGRRAMHNAVYLMQAAGIQLGHHFRWYSRPEAFHAAGSGEEPQ